MDVRASLNSLIPSGIAGTVAAPVIETSIDKLRRHPELHDRIETELQPTCIGFANEWSRQLSNVGLGAPAQRVWRDALIAIEPIWQRFSASSNSDERATSSLRDIEASCYACHTASDLKSILSRIRQTFALPFAMHARLAFVARFQLSSLVTAGALSPERHNYLLSCVSAITSAAGVNAHGVGALRPATFDICVEPVQIEAIVANAARAGPLVKPTFRLTKGEQRAVTLLLKPWHLQSNAEMWIADALGRIERRELWKYGLSQAVSSWLSATTRWGQGRGLRAHELSYLTIKNLANGNDLGRLRRHSLDAKKRYDIEGTIKMPLLISDRRDFRASIDPALRPTFQTHGQGRVSAPLCMVGRHTEARVIAAGAAVLIQAADPGYDWIFQYPLAVLVTCYGGPHSHMAVRCAELNVPCVLGCGETVYGALCEAAHVTIDFEQQHMSVGA